MIPTSVVELSADFVAGALGRPAAEISRCRLEPLTGERGMSATLVRLHLAGHRAGLPASLIGKLPPADTHQRSLLEQMGFFQREVTFYRRFAAAEPVLTARCYLADRDPDTGQAVLLLEDLGSAGNGNTNGNTIAGATVDEVTAVLLALARLHARWWQNGDVVEQAWARLPSMLAPSAVVQVFEQAWPAFRGKLDGLGDEVSASKAWISRRLGSAAHTLFETGARTLVHNDVQPDNWFLGPEGGRAVVLIDWQMTTYGRCVVDVASAIRASLDVPVRRDVEPALVRLYHDALMEAGVSGYPLAQCQADYQLATVLAPARLASAVGLTSQLQAHPGAFWDVLFPRLTAR